MPPMRGHLTAVRVWVGGSADCGKELFERRHAELEAESSVAVVRIKPIIAGLQSHAGCDQYCLVPSTTDLKENLILVFELDFLVVDAAREIHRAVHLEHLFARKTRALPAFSISVLFALTSLLGSTGRFGSS